MGEPLRVGESYQAIRDARPLPRSASVWPTLKATWCACSRPMVSPIPHHVERSVLVLRETGARRGSVATTDTKASRPAANAIGVAMVSPFGMGSPHRFVRERAVVDTISHPAYLRLAMEEVGSFDEGLERNSDYEFNYRLRAAGGQLLFRAPPSDLSIAPEGRWPPSADSSGGTDDGRPGWRAAIRVPSVLAISLRPPPS